MNHSTDEKLNRKNFNRADIVQIEDWMVTCGETSLQIPGNGKTGIVIRRSTPEDIAEGGYPLGENAYSCWLVAVGGEKKPAYHYHNEWLKKV